MKGSTVSRRFSEFAGVALFGLRSSGSSRSRPTTRRPGPLLQHRLPLDASQLCRPRRRVSRRTVISAVGYTSYFIPAALVIVGWNYFWCRKPDAAATKVAGAVLLVACVSTFLSLVFGTLAGVGQAVPRGRVPRRVPGARDVGLPGAHRIAHRDSCADLLAIMMSTQFSFGRFFGSLLSSLKSAVVDGIDSFHGWREERRRERERARSSPSTPRRGRRSLK